MADNTVGQNLTQRDTLAFGVFQALIIGKMSHQDACTKEEGKPLALLAYQLASDFLAHRSDV
jgi:hypothetical protein